MSLLVSDRPFSFLFSVLRRPPFLFGSSPSSLPLPYPLAVDPLLYDSLIRHFHTPAEREAEGREKGYSRTLESSLLRGEARLAKLASTTQEAGDTSGGGGGDELPDADEPPTSGAEVPAASLVVGSAAGTTTTGFEIDVAIAPPATTREEGRERWEEFLRDRFVRGGDDEFEYRGVDENDDLDVLERKDREEEWFDDETPDWASTPRAEEELEEEEEQKMKEGEDRGGMRPERILHGETGVQDF